MERLSLSKAILLVGMFIGFVFQFGCGVIIYPQSIVSVANTQNPLVAQFWVGADCVGQAMVEFGPDTSYGRNTAWYPIAGDYKRTGILVAGMRASTTYHMRAQVQCVGQTGASKDLTFVTGPLPSNPFPTIRISRPNPSLAGSENPGIELVNAIVPKTSTIQGLYTDRDGNPIWYYDVGANNSPYTMKLLPNGHMIISIQKPDSSTLREVDLAGNTIRELDIVTLQKRVQAAGFDFVPGGYHHDVLPLDNGHLIVLVAFTQAFTDLPGYPGITQVQGDGLIDLDPDWNPVWAWNGFDHLDVNRHLDGLPDWTHSNAIVYLPGDGNLLLSMRHQSWVLKIDYSNGTGTGNVLWRLGYQGDFALAQGDDPSLWFSYQHFPSLINQSGPQTTLAVWDNGDFRVLDSSGHACGSVGFPPCYSRATVYQVDESTMMADLEWALAPGPFSVWGGSVNQLANGNIEFDLNAPLVPPAPGVAAHVEEVTQTPTPQIVWEMDVSPGTMNAYRAYRVPSLYPGVTWQY